MLLGCRSCDSPGAFSRRVAFLSALSTVLLAHPVQAGVTVPSQSRTVEVHIGNTRLIWNGGANPFYPDYAPPTNTTQNNLGDQVLQTLAGGAYAATASVASRPLTDASQTSLVTPELISFDGSVDAQGLAWTFSSPPFVEFGINNDHHEMRSTLEVSFRVDQPTGYSLTGSMNLLAPVVDPYLVEYQASSHALVRLSGFGGQVVAEAEGGAPNDCVDPFGCTVPPAPVGASGTLAPGGYTLLAQIEGKADGLCVYIVDLECIEPIAQGGFDLTLTLSPASLPAAGPWATGLLVALLAGAGAWHGRARV